MQLENTEEEEDSRDKEDVDIEGSQPEWCISSMMYSGDTPFWLETLDIVSGLQVTILYYQGFGALFPEVIF